MIYDPFDLKIAMDHHGHLYTPESYGVDDNGNPNPIWVRMPQIRPNGTFRHPEW